MNLSRVQWNRANQEKSVKLYINCTFLFLFFCIQLRNYNLSHLLFNTDMTFFGIPNTKKMSLSQNFLETNFNSPTVQNTSTNLPKSHIFYKNNNSAWRMKERLSTRSIITRQITPTNVRKKSRRCDNYCFVILCTEM